MITYGEKRSVNEIRSILNSQWRNGMLPQIRFVEGQKGYSPDAKEWGVNKKISGSKVETSGITQPPNPGFALWYLYRDSKNKKELLKYLEEFYEPLKRYHDFLLLERDPKKINLAVIFHPWASGTDNSPCYDELIEETRKTLKKQKYEQAIKKRKDIKKVILEYRPGEKDYDCYGRLISFYIKHNYNQKIISEKCPFVVYDVLFNSILVESINSMAKIAEVLSKTSNKKNYYQKELIRNKELVSRMKKTINEKLYDKESGLFYNFDVRNNKLIKVKTIHSLSPLFGNIASKKRAEGLIKAIKDDKLFNPKKGIRIPSTALNEKKFDNLRYWIGPVWPVTNWIIIKGLENYDMHLANKLKKETVKMISENYDIKKVKIYAAQLMEYTSFGEEFTTPSRAQYSHGWLWDSGFTAIGWRHVEKKETVGIWEKIKDKKNKLMEKGVDLKKIRKILGKEFKRPFFDEYYSPISARGHKTGDPIGAEMMTWTAALFLDLVSK